MERGGERGGEGRERGWERPPHPERDRDICARQGGERIRERMESYVLYGSVFFSNSNYTLPHAHRFLPASELGARIEECLCVRRREREGEE